MDSQRVEPSEDDFEPVPELRDADELAALRQGVALGEPWASLVGHGGRRRASR